MIRRPLLAPQEDPMSYPRFFEELKFPLLVSPKLDGIRGITQGGVLSRTMKAIRSYQVQDRYGNLRYCDGELVIGDPTNPDCYNLCQSHIMSFDKPHDGLAYYVFDWLENTTRPFWQRLEKAEQYVLNNQDLVEDLFFVPHTRVETLEELIEYENKCLALGYEGVMMRDPFSYYKEGRGTWREGIIYKLKRFTDTEAKVVGFEERKLNTNAQELDERGYAKRSKALEGLVGANTVGKFLVDYNDEIIPIAPGTFKHSELDYIWDNQDQFIGKQLKFRFFGYGILNKPRFPRAVGFREAE